MMQGCVRDFMQQGEERSTTYATCMPVHCNKPERDEVNKQLPMHEDAWGDFVVRLQDDLLESASALA